MSTSNDIIIVTQKLRTRLAEFRNEHINQEQSIHISTLEIALGLVEFAIQKNRKINLDEKQWFNGGREIDLVLGNSEWEDIRDLYFEMITQAKKSHIL